MKSSESSKQKRQGRAKGAQGALVAAAALVAFATVSQPAHAEVGKDDASATAKGAVGGALLGAEAVTFGMALFDVQNPWAYVIGGGVGAAAGGVGGYFLEDAIDARGAMLMLAAGMVLAIPTTVYVLDTAAYRPPADYIKDTAPMERTEAPKSIPASGGPGPSKPYGTQIHRTRPQRLALRRPAPPSLVGMDDGVWTLSVPAVALLDVYTPETRRKFDLKQESELRVPVLALRF